MPFCFQALKLEGFWSLVLYCILQLAFLPYHLGYDNSWGFFHVSRDVNKLTLLIELYLSFLFLWRTLTGASTGGFLLLDFSFCGRLASKNVGTRSPRVISEEHMWITTTPGRWSKIRFRISSNIPMWKWPEKATFQRRFSLDCLGMLCRKMGTLDLILSMAKRRKKKEEEEEKTWTFFCKIYIQVGAKQPWLDSRAIFLAIRRDKIKI